MRYLICTRPIPPTARKIKNIGKSEVWEKKKNKTKEAGEKKSFKVLFLKQMQLQNLWVRLLNKIVFQDFRKKWNWNKQVRYKTFWCLVSLSMFTRCYTVQLVKLLSDTTQQNV